MRYIKPAVLSITNAMSTIQNLAKESNNPEISQPSVTAAYEADE